MFGNTDRLYQIGTEHSARPDTGLGSRRYQSWNNSATNVHYSGTMGVVFEGCLNGIPSIGFSLCNHAPDADFEATGPYIRSIAAMVLEKDFLL